MGFSCPCCATDPSGLCLNWLDIVLRCRILVFHAKQSKRKYFLEEFTLKFLSRGNFLCIRGMWVSEVQIGNVPIPLVNYIYLIRDRKSPYYDIVQHILREMETHYSKTGQSISETVYTINPRVLQEQVEKLVQSEKLTTVNVCRTVLALLYGSSLREDKDFFVTTTSGGRRNYHVKVNPHTMNMLCRFV